MTENLFDFDIVFNKKILRSFVRKKLNPKARITYEIPTTIGQKLTIYKEFALNKIRKQIKGVSRSCDHCTFCTCHGENNKSMVQNISQLLTKK